jgi:RNA polymerase sigma-70 factor (ECF subfamily)
METEAGAVTALLARVNIGDEQAMDQLMPLVYQELRRLAGHFLRQERDGHTLQPTALVHEAYLCLIGQDRANWQNRAQFMAIAAQSMRRILLQYARRRRASKRMAPPGDMREPATPPERWEEVLTVDEAITRLAEFAPQQARLVEMRYFGGLSVEEAAVALDLSPRTVKREWAAAKGFLHTELSGIGLE